MPMTPPPPVSSASWPAPRAWQRVDQPAPLSETVASVVVTGSRQSSTDFDEHTTVSSRRQRLQNWTLTLPGGAVELVTGSIIVGRSPEFSPALPSARLVPVPDPTRSVSKNHAVFRVSDGVLGVQDLGSTNGIIVTGADGREIDLGVGGSHDLEPGARVELGDVVLTVGRS
jgi:hypothetical protein